MSYSTVNKIIDNLFKTVSDGSNHSDQLATPLRVSQVFMQNFSSGVCGHPVGIALGTAIPLLLVTGGIRVYDQHKKKNEAHSYMRLTKRLQAVVEPATQDDTAIDEEADLENVKQIVEESSYLKNSERLAELEKKLANAEKNKLDASKKQKLEELINIVKKKIHADEEQAKTELNNILSTRMGKSAKKYQVAIEPVTKQLILTKKTANPQDNPLEEPEAESAQADDTSKQPNIFLRLVKRVRESSVGKIFRTVWNTMATYSMFYWLTFMVANLAFGLAVAASSVAVLAIPLVVPLGYFIWKLGTTIYDRYQQGKKTPEEKAAGKGQQEEELEKQKIMKELIQRTFIQKEHEAFAEQIARSKQKTNDFVSSTGLPLQPVNNASIVNLPQPEQQPIKKPDIRERLTGSRLGNAFRVGFAAVSGLVGGYVIAQFVAWPITTILSFSPVIAATLAGPVGIIALFAVTAAIGVFFAVKQAAKARTEQIEMSNMAELKLKEKNNEKTLQKVEAEIAQKQASIKTNQQKLNRELDRYCNLYQENHKLVARGKPSLNLEKINRNDWNPGYRLTSIDNNRYFQEQQHKPSRFTLFKKGLNRLLQFTNGAGTGMFVVRSLLLAGGIASLFFSPSLLVVFGIGLAVAATWGIAKLYEYKMERDKANKKAMIEDLEVRIDYLEKKKAELEKYDELLVENHTKLKQLNETTDAQLPREKHLGSSVIGNGNNLVSSNDHPIPQSAEPTTNPPLACC